MVIGFTGLVTPPDPPNVPAASSVFSIAIIDKDNNNIGTAFQTADGVETLNTIITALTADLTGSLPGGFTVTANLTNKTITIQSASYFTTAAAFYEEFSPFLYHALNVKIIQNYIAALSATQGQPQISVVRLTADLVVPGEIYSLVFRDSGSVEHKVQYTSITTDNAAQILAGLVAAISASSDSFFRRVVTQLDSDAPSLTISTPNGITPDATMERGPLPPTPVPPVPVPPTYWAYVPFPRDLAQQVIQGAYSDYLKMEGQTDKGMVEEKGALEQQAEVVGAKVAPPYPPLTDQQQPATRFRGAG